MSKAATRCLIGLNVGDLVDLDMGIADKSKNAATACVEHRHDDGSVCLKILTPKWAATWGLWKGCDGLLRVPYHSPLIDEPLDYSIRRHREEVRS